MRAPYYLSDTIYREEDLAPWWEYTKRRTLHPSLHIEEGVTGGVSGAPTVELRGQSVATDCQWISGSWTGDTGEVVDQEQERCSS